MPAVGLSDGVHTTLPHFARSVSTLLLDSRDDTATYASHLDPHTAHLQSRASGLSSYSSVNSAGILAARQRRIIQLMCVCMSCFSILAAMCAIYWFTIMRRNYRRDLVLMLILGGFYKNLWYLIYGSVNLGRGQVKSSDPFCQVSGFMLQTGLEACGK